VDEEVLQRLSTAVLEARGYKSQREFAQQLGVAQSTVQSWENRRNVPNLENLEKLAEIRGELPEEFVAFLYGRILAESPIDRRIRGMSRRDVARLTRAIAEWIEGE
jgi:transcriptional regulator with XRE-family HTH domain